MAVAAPSGRNRRSHSPLRILTAVPLCDGHDSAIMTINQELVARGAEVVYLGYHQSATAIARAAIQEDVHAIGISSYNGGHLVFFREVVSRLRNLDAGEIRVFGGGGGTITTADERVMRRIGVERVFFAGTPLDEMARDVFACAREMKPVRKLTGDRSLARAITLAETPARSRGGSRLDEARSGVRALSKTVAARRPFVLGVAGPGGAGKSTLIDELTARFLRSQRGRIAILANDPSHPDSKGALLGDRVSAIYAQDDRVFFRSMATRGSLAGVSAATAAAIEAVASTAAFDLIIVESVGIGQESDPFGTLGSVPSLVDATVFVISPHYGGRIQLEKIALLGRADLVVLNKCDDARSATARTEIAAVLSRRTPTPGLHLTIAARHDDDGLETFYAAVADRAGLSSAGGERPCQLQITA